ncbi:MAG: cupin domain-containing protein [Nitrospiraceae bacterium]|nr:cupin domain-containing protein [Nitrospiraceae bacterium]
MKKGGLLRLMVASAALGLLLWLPTGTAGEKIEVFSLDQLLKGKPLPQDKTAHVIPVTKVQGAEVQVIEMSKIRLHSHKQEDHIVYIAKGQGKAKLGNETRDVKAGEIIMIPRNIPHSFDKSGTENLVLLVIATPGWKPLEDTTFYDK